jgi:hypothetical protein
MTSPFLLGVFSAWAVTHLGLALFFALAYVIGRREREYLLFTLLCAAFSALTFGTVLDLSVRSMSLRLLADEAAHTAAIWAAILNLHFALLLAFPGRRYRLLPIFYGLAVVLSLAVWSGALWGTNSYHLGAAQAFGQRMVHGQGEPTWIGWVFYAVGIAETLYAIVVIFLAYFSGRRDVLTVLLSSVCVGAATINDALLMVGVT